MHSMFDALCYPPIWWNFSAVPAFCGVSDQILHCFYSFLQLLMACWCIWFIVTGDKRCFSCRYGISDHFRLYFRYYILDFCQLWPAFSLVYDRLGGQVSEQNGTGTLDKHFWRNCRYSILCVCSGLTSLSTIFQSYHNGVWFWQGAQCSVS